MNWLAHILLSKPDVEYQLGNFLADPLKGKVWEGASSSVKNGMLMHRFIDGFTDAHDIVRRSKSRLGNKGYLKGVIIDLLYDHFLAKGWDRYVDVSLSSFLQTFYTEAISAVTSYPNEPKKIVTLLVHSNRLASYSEFGGFTSAVQRMNERLSPRIRKKDSALNYMEAVKREYAALNTDFELFFPELIAFFKNHELGSGEDSYLIEKN